MTLILPLAAAGTDPCASCGGSADGCQARRAARAGRCCSGCTHPDPQGEVRS